MSVTLMLIVIIAVAGIPIGTYVFRRRRAVHDELIAVITAAAVTAIQQTVRVRRIRLFTGETGGAWASVGRLNIMASHSILRRKP